MRVLIKKNFCYSIPFFLVKIGPGITLMSRPMSYEPDNGPEIVIPDSDTWTPADSEGTVVCILVGKIVTLVHKWQF